MLSLLGSWAKEDDPLVSVLHGAELQVCGGLLLSFHFIVDVFFVVNIFEIGY